MWKDYPESGYSTTSEQIRCLSSFQTSCKERQFLGNLNCCFYSPVLGYPFLHGMVISSLVPSPDLSAKRNNDMKPPHNCIPLYSYSIFKRLPIMCWHPVSAFIALSTFMKLGMNNSGTERKMLCGPCSLSKSTSCITENSFLSLIPLQY